MSGRNGICLCARYVFFFEVIIKIPEVQEMNQRLESEVIGLSLILRDAADRENVYNARFGMSVDLICKYFEEIALGSSFT